MQYDSKVLERFWRLVTKTETCWRWMGYRNKFGHGRIGVGHELFMAHRFSWCIHNGEIPAKMCVLHHCDNPECVNPSHLFLGTRADNNSDRDAKGRGAKGEKMNRGVLTVEKVKEIKRRLANNESHAHIATSLSISTRNVKHILHGDSWKHVTI